MKKEIKILQLVNRTNYRFEDWSYAESNGFNILDYTKVASFDINSNDNDFDLLRKIYELGNNGAIQQIFNQLNSTDFYIRSISKSDIIMIDSVMYYVDALGFKPIYTKGV